MTKYDQQDVFDRTHKLRRDGFTPQFGLGNIVSTPGALQAFEDAEQHILTSGHLLLHSAGDWGEVPEEDWKENDFSVENDFRVLSAYTLDTGVKFWIITEWDRSATTFLLPSEY